MTSLTRALTTLSPASSATILTTLCTKPLGPQKLRSPRTWQLEPQGLGWDTKPKG